MTDQPARPDVSLRKVGHVTVETMNVPAAADGSGQVAVHTVAPGGVRLPTAPAAAVPSVTRAR